MDGHGITIENMTISNDDDNNMEVGGWQLR